MLKKVLTTGLILVAAGLSLLASAADVARVSLDFKNGELPEGFEETWAVVSDGDKKALTTKDAAAWAEGVILNDDSISKFTLELKVKIRDYIDKSDSDWWRGLTIKLDKSESKGVRINFTTSGMQFQDRKHGEQQEFYAEGKETRLAENQWHTIKIVANNKLLQVFVNGENKYTGNTTEPIKGHLSIIQAGGGTLFTDIVVMAAPPPTTAPTAGTTTSGSASTTSTAPENGDGTAADQTEDTAPTAGTTDTTAGPTESGETSASQSAAPTAPAGATTAPVSGKRAGLSGGAVAGIVIGIVVLAGGGTGGFLFYRRKKGQSTLSDEQTPE